MYLGVDVGASKILFAVFDEGGRKLYEHKIKTNHDYHKFLDDIKAALTGPLSGYKFKAWCCAIPGELDYKNGIAIAFGNFEWTNLPIRNDLEALMPDSALYLHNDAKLAALSEVNALDEKPHKALYLTLSTGIGAGVIKDGRIDEDFEVLEPGQMVFDFEGKKQDWEDFASGRALAERHGKLASEIEDPKIWQEYAKLVAIGLIELLAIIHPDLIIIGGGAGGHLEKFQKFLEAELDKEKNPMVPIPPIVKAKNPEEAVIYGCYEYIRQNENA